MIIHFLKFIRNENIKKYFKAFYLFVVVYRSIETINWKGKFINSFIVYSKNSYIRFVSF